MDIFHFSIRAILLLITIIVNHSAQVWKVLLAVAQDERRPEKIELLLSALTLVQQDPAVEKLIRELQLKKA